MSISFDQITDDCAVELQRCNCEFTRFIQCFKQQEFDHSSQLYERHFTQRLEGFARKQHIERDARSLFNDE